MMKLDDRGKEDLIKKAIIDKDNKIIELKSTIDILQRKLQNSEDENNKLMDKINNFKEMINQYYDESH